MTNTPPPKTGLTHQQILLAGLITVIPVWITWLVVAFLIRLILDIGSPVVNQLAYTLEPYLPTVSRWLLAPFFQSVAALALVFIGLYLLGWAGTHLLGRMALAAFDRLVNRIPLIKSLYGGVKQLLGALQQKPDGVQRVVLIDFPTPQMKAIGFVTRTLTDQRTGRELAAVYVPTTPNPTSGYLEIVPVENIVSTDMTMDEAMKFIVSGGAVAPEHLNYENLPPTSPTAS